MTQGSPNFATTPFGEVAYSVSGDPAGPPLLLLPGFQSSRTSWIDRGYIDRLGDFRVLNVDPLGALGGGIHCATQQMPAV